MCEGLETYKEALREQTSVRAPLWEVFTCNSNSNSVVFCIYSLFSLLFLNVLQKSLECSENIAIQILQRSCDMIF